MTIAELQHVRTSTFRIADDMSGVLDQILKLIQTVHFRFREFMPRDTHPREIMDRNHIRHLEEIELTLRVGHMKQIKASTRQSLRGHLALLHA